MPVRLVSLAAHSGTGKTTLAEALLHRSGAISRVGRVEDGTTQSDHTPEEHAHGFSIKTGVLRLKHRDTDITVLDTPGFADFVREIRGGMRAADSAVILVSGTGGVEVGTERVWTHADNLGMPRIVAVTKMDRDRAHFLATVAELRASLPGPIVPAFIPDGEGVDFKGVINVLSADPDELSGETRHALEEAKSNLTDAIVETDDGLMNRYLDGEEISQDELRRAFHAAVHAGKLFPAIPVSGTTEVGVPELLDLMVDGLRSAQERGELTGVDGQTRAPTADAPFSARVWRMSIDPFMGRVAYLRVWSGTLKAGDTVRNTTRGEDVKPAHLYVMNGKDLTEVPELSAGMIGVITKNEHLHTGDTLADPAHPIQYEALQLPDVVYTVALHPNTRQDEDRLGDAVAKLLEEDPTLRFGREPQTGEMLLGGMGEMHTNIAVEKLAALGVNVQTTPPQIPYRETIRASAKAQGKHKKQSGGHGQYGDCHVQVKPGEGYAFGSAVVGGAIPGKYLPSIEKGVQDVMERGPLAGFPLQDVHFTVLDGSYHEVDSSDLAFRTAGSLAARAALEQARPVLLEPVMLLKVRAPAQYTGDLMGDLQGRRARVQGMEPDGTVFTISAVVPQSELRSYDADLRSLTGGRGAYSVKHHGYQEVPEHLAKKVIEERKAQLAAQA